MAIVFNESTRQFLRRRGYGAIWLYPRPHGHPALRFLLEAGTG